ncbi:MAG: hypothetical protein ACJ8EL_17015 [Rhizomicrobium sp.]
MILKLRPENVALSLLPLALESADKSDGARAALELLTMTVAVRSTGATLATLTNKGGGKYEGQFSVPSNPGNITVTSSAFGSATRAVVAK